MTTRTNLEPILQKLEATKRLEELQSVIVSLKRALDIDHAVYHWVDSGGEQYGCGTYSFEWLERYAEQNYLRTDPVITGCFQRFHPVDWKRLDWSSKNGREFFAVAVDHWIGNQGFSVPIRGPKGQVDIF